MLYHLTQNYSNYSKSQITISYIPLLLSTPEIFTKFHSITHNSLHKIITINHRVRKKLTEGWFFSWKKKKKSRRRSSSGRRLPSPQASTTFSPSLVSTILFFFFFSSSRQVRRGVCLVAALSTTVAKATPLPRWAFRARFHPFVARIPLVHTRLCVRTRARVYQRWNDTRRWKCGEDPWEEIVFQDWRFLHFSVDFRSVFARNNLFDEIFEK